ncbi:hypothetical protein [Pseudomaricurvus hydrocarbonicus]|uniref:hypothetical protein n=1 Tax=Pseudomaricurvus hydrocarbonicus TaxID=1470433 RepID=UPI001FB7F6CC|nr:hypothetical protein [Aestuariicella hydrocarbonica]
MEKTLNFSNTLDWFMAALAVIVGVAVLQTFILGQHYIIPTVLLVLTVLLGNLAWYGLHQAAWAKRVNFWCGLLLTAHFFFALFWSKKYRELLGDQFEWVCAAAVLVVGLLTWLYATKNRLWVPATRLPTEATSSASAAKLSADA